MNNNLITFGSFLDRIPKSTHCVCVLGVVKTIPEWKVKEEALGLIVKKREYLRPFKSWSLTLQYPENGQMVGDELRHYLEKTDRLFVIRRRGKKNMTSYLRNCGYSDNASFASVRYAKVYSDYVLAWVDLYPVKIHYPEETFEIVEIDKDSKPSKKGDRPYESEDKYL